MGYGFREIIVDQPFSGKWTEVDMNLGGGHGTFQGSKFSDSAGGFSYRNPPETSKHILQNRFIYWRVLNDMLEMTESSMDYNLEDNQVRIVFPDSPIVSPISISETETSVVILVVTVTSANRFVFLHPNKTFTEDQKLTKGNKQPSIFLQASAKPLMNFSSFPLFEHSINIPVPITAGSHIMPNNLGYVLALSYESGCVTIYKITKDDTLVLYDLRQANIFARLLSFTPSILRVGSNSVSVDAVVGLTFFIAKVEHSKKNLYLVTLTTNGHLRLYMCTNLNTIDSWIVLTDVLVDKRFGIAGYIDSTMVLRKYHENLKEYPKFVIFVPGDGFKVFQCLRDERGPGQPKLVLNETSSIKFKEKSMIDFCVTSDFLFTLVSNPDEETDWEVKCYDLNEQLNSRFNLALLEPPPQTVVYSNTPNTEPKEYYSNLIFNKSSFSASTIYSALTMFECSEMVPKENDWELTKFHALRVIENEIRSITAESDEPVADDDIYKLNLKCWGDFYTSCVELHINTVKPFGIFYEFNTKLVCIVKKSRISFLRPTDFLETALYFPHLIVPSLQSEETSNQNGSLLKYLEIMDIIESTLVESHKFKIEKRILENKQNSMSVWEELANLLIDTDPHSDVLERRHFAVMLTTRLQELKRDGIGIMKYMIDLISSWDNEIDIQELGPVSVFTEENERSQGVTQFFMSSRLGCNVTYRILKQLLNHRYMIGRNTLLLQAIVRKLESESENKENTDMIASFHDRQTAQFTFLRCYSILALFERTGEFVHENWSENGIKVANLLNCRPSDQLIHGKIPEFWPIQLVELFCNSGMGGLAIRSRVNRFRHSMVLAYADAAGRAIWPNDDASDHPFEDFLIAAGQYSTLSFYATELEHHRKSDVERAVLRVFYNGVADLFLRSPQAALSRFLSISTEDLEDAPYFCTKILGIQNQTQFYPNCFFEKVINLFQIFGFTYAVQRLAEKALSICREDRWVRIMSVLGFKSALTLGDYEMAFQFILRMPKHSVGMKGESLTGKERESSIRTFVTKVLENNDIDVLVGLKTESYSNTIRDEIERVLHAQAKLSDPLVEDSVYQMVYFYHLCRKNYEMAAMAMLERVTQVGLKGKGRNALEIQRDAYLDILTCISLSDGNMDLMEINNVGSGDSGDINDWMLVLQNTKISTTTESITIEDHFEIKKRIKSYEKMLRECELCISLLLLKDDKEVGPIKFSFELQRAETCVRGLIQIHQYDQAIKLSKMWDIPYLPVVSSFAKTCVNLVYNILPLKGDPADYVRHFEITDLPNSNANIADLAFLILKNYVQTLEKSKETKLHQQVALILLSYCVNLPRWLIDSYKKRDVNQLILCFMRYGDWEEASDLVLETLDVALGRRDAKGFDPSVQVVTSYQSTPIIPYNTIEDLMNQINQYLIEKPQLVEILQNLRERCDDFCLRVLETRQERRLMFGI